MGPCVEVLVQSADFETALLVDEILTRHGKIEQRTHRGLGWEVRIRDLPFTVQLEAEQPHIGLCAMCKGPENYEILRNLAAELAAACNGLVVGDPDK